ncbi:MAG: CusA/CzcA family heavy metal efflux RND transporter [Thermodesulfobacteriota bacterium]|nr:CusA/CzcA family heavy metal efflux RND transporter [Thermodesulfobacteriota bacterium]
MVKWIIEKSVENRLIVIIVTILAFLLGLWATLNTPVDAIPDLSDVQVIIYTPYTGQAPQVVEDQVTYPLSTAMLSVPYAKTVRGFSFFGFSLVYVIFEDGTDIYWARSRVMEYLNFVSGRLPEGVSPQLGPDATGVGWGFIYTLTSDRHDLAQLRSIQDWYLKYDLMSVPGVAEVASAGGFVRQYQVEVDPEKMRAFGLSLKQINMAIEKSNMDVGGRLLEMGETEFMVRSKGYIETIEDLRDIPVALDEKTHTPILLSQVAHIQIGPEIRRCVIEMDGQGEAVSGIVVIRFGENALEVIERVKARLEELEAGLPKGVSVHISYDRSALILRAMNTLKNTILKEMLVVALVSLVFLLHFRSAFVAIFTLPVGIVLSFILVKFLGIKANIMSLGGIAIAIGVMVDASIVMVENLHKHKETGTHLPHKEMVIKAAREVGPALFFSLLVVTVSFLPVFTLQQQEGRLFSPLAYTKTFAMAVSAVLAITIIPVLMYYFVKGKIINESKNPLNNLVIFLYRPVIRLVLKFPVATILIALMLTGASLYPFAKLGSEFMPPLNEGDLLYMPTTPPGISITAARTLLQQTDKIIKEHPQVTHVLGKVGRADTATDPAPLSMLETHIILKPESEWPDGKTIEDIIRELDRMVQFPGLTNSWTMPIKTRIDMLATGIKTPVGIKLLGANLGELSALGQEMEALLRALPEVSSVFSERVVGGNYVEIDVNRRQAARYGLKVGDVQGVIKTALGGMTITVTMEGLERYPVNVRYPRELRDDVEKIKRLTVPSPMGHAIPLGEIADIYLRKGVPAIKSENAKRTAWIYVDLKTQDIGGFVEKAKETLSQNITLPAGVSMAWSGQYEYMERANKRLSLVVPMTIALIFLLLFFHFRNITESLIVMVTLPFALIGGVWLMFILGYNMSVAVVVGFIALAGLAAETGVIMLVYLDQSYNRWKQEGRLKTFEDLHDIIVEGAVMRVRPKLMTVATDLFALLAIMFITETGSRVMKRIAAPMVGGLLSSTVLTLVIIPAVYLLWRKWQGVEKDKT